jgi:hypothetical protein
MHYLKKSIFAFGHGRTSRWGRQARHDQVDHLSQFFGRRRRLCPAPDIFGDKTVIEIANGNVMAVPDEASGELSADITKADKSNFHVSAPSIPQNVALVRRVRATLDGTAIVQFKEKLERQPGQTTIEKFGLSGEIFFNQSGG